MGVQEHQVARDAGDGSRDAIDEKYDSTEYKAKDQRADTRTTFYERDIQNLNVSRRRKKELKRALERQRGLDYGEGSSSDKTRRQRKQQNREEWKRRVASAYTSQLEMSRTSKDRVEHLVFDVLDFASFGPYSTEKIILGIINVVAREQGRFVEDEETFHEMMLAAGLGEDDSPDLTRMHRLRRMVRERMDT